MTGGLLQMVVSGKQDVYLTIDPEITFFKRVYRRHTNFATELIEILPEQNPDFDSKISFILNRGDAIHRCYFEITLPEYSFSDQYITDQSYINRKNLQIVNLQTKLTDFQLLYSNLKGFIDIEIQLYRILSSYLETDNVTINNLKDQVIRFNYKAKLSKDQFLNKIDEVVFKRIDMSGYITGITKLIATSITYDKTKFISKAEIKAQLNQMYNLMVYYLDEYNDEIIALSNEITDKTQSNQIKFNFAEYLGHNFFDEVTLEIGGQEIDSYTKDILHINQSHSISQDNMDNYLEMIGYVPEMITYNDLPKGGRKILIPLIFWFCKNPGASLPLVAMQYSSVVINAKISSVNKILCFENYTQHFIDMATITIDNSYKDKYILNNNLFYESATFNYLDDTISYFCPLINKELLKIKFSDLSDLEIDIILANNAQTLTLNQITKILKPHMSETDIATKNGVNGEQTHMVITQNLWIKFLANMRKPIYSSFIYKIMDYYPFIDYNLYCSTVTVPDIKLVYESVFMDDVERAKFAGSQLEYVVERYDDDIYTVKNKNFFDCDIGFTNPCKELIWYIQPQIFTYGFSEFNQNLSLRFNIDDYYTNNIISKQKIVLNQHDLLLDKVDSNYYTYLLSWKFLNNILPEGVYYHSFCLYPEETQPSGTANFRVIKGKQYIVNFNSEWLKEYTNQLSTIFSTQEEIDNKSALNIKLIGKIYDLFIVSNGKANLMFS